jgi:hypothetical protein
MSESARDYQSVLQQARRLPAKAQRQLAETLLRPKQPQDEEVMVVTVRRMDAASQERLQALMERNNQGELNPRERTELEALVARYEALMLSNTEALLRSSHPELFARSGVNG